VLAVGRNVFEIAYHLLGEQTTYRGNSGLATSTATAPND
jgi:hypothetical protein